MEEDEDDHHDAHHHSAIPHHHHRHHNRSALETLHKLKQESMGEETMSGSETDSGFRSRLNSSATALSSQSNHTHISTNTGVSATTPPNGQQTTPGSCANSGSCPSSGSNSHKSSTSSSASSGNASPYHHQTASSGGESTPRKLSPSTGGATHPNGGRQHGSRACPPTGGRTKQNAAGPGEGFDASEAGVWEEDWGVSEVGDARGCVALSGTTRTHPIYKGLPRATLRFKALAPIRREWGDGWDDDYHLQSPNNNECATVEGLEEGPHHPTTPSFEWCTVPERVVEEAVRQFIWRLTAVMLDQLVESARRAQVECGMGESGDLTG